MKRSVIVAFSLCLLCAMSIMAQDFPKHMQVIRDSDGVIKVVGYGTPQSIAVEAGSGFINLSTPTMTIGSNTPTIINPLPSGCKNIYVTSFGGATLVGPSGITSGTAYLAATSIASGTTVKIDGIGTTTPAIYFLSNETTATTLKMVGWGN